MEISIAIQAPKSDLSYRFEFELHQNGGTVFHQNKQCTNIEQINKPKAQNEAIVGWRELDSQPISLSKFAGACRRSKFTGVNFS